MCYAECWDFCCDEVDCGDEDCMEECMEPDGMEW